MCTCLAHRGAGGKPPCTNPRVRLCRKAFEHALHSLNASSRGAKDASRAPSARASALARGARGLLAGGHRGWGQRMTSPPPSILRPHSLFLTISQYHPVSLAIGLPLSCPLAHVIASSRASERTCMRAFPFSPCTCSALASSLTDQAMDLTLKTETVTLNQRDFETVTVTCVTLTYDARWMGS